MYDLWSNTQYWNGDEDMVTIFWGAYYTDVCSYKVSHQPAWRAFDVDGHRLATRV